MNNDSILTAALILSTAVIVLVKVGFLIWVFSRSQKPVAIVYAAYILISAVVSTGLPAFLSQFFSGSEDVAAYTLTLATYGVVNALVEVVLFIWFVRSLLKRAALPLINNAVEDA
ncbi:MAG: hypothetical protein WBA76_05575 [Phormidesmis sp.]